MPLGRDVRKDPDEVEYCCIRQCKASIREGSERVLWACVQLAHSSTKAVIHSSLSSLTTRTKEHLTLQPALLSFTWQLRSSLSALTCGDLLAQSRTRAESTMSGNDDHRGRGQQRVNAMSPPNADADFAALSGRMMNPDPTNEFMYQLGPAQVQALHIGDNQDNRDGFGGGGNDLHMSGGNGQSERGRQTLE